MRLPSYLLIGTILASCSSMSVSSLNKQYVGQDVGSFFAQHGGPSSSFATPEGGTVYTWSGGTETYQMPQTTTMNLNPTFGGGYTGTATTYNGGTLNVSCSASIMADKDGRIQTIRFIQDTIGNWTTSRCAEVFGL